MTIEIRTTVCETFLNGWRSSQIIWETQKQSQRVIDDSDNVDFIPLNVQSSRQEVLLYVFEDNEAVIKMIIGGRSPTMRHVSRTHRVALDWLFDRINLDSKIQIKYTDTKKQLADKLTKGLCLFNISHFSSTVCSEVMSKRTQQESGEERDTAKSRPMMNLIARAPSNLSSSASESPGKKNYGRSAKAEKFDRTEQPVVTSRAKTHESQPSFSHEKTKHVILEEEETHDRPNQKGRKGKKDELPEVCSQFVLKCLYLARIGRHDILWSVNKLARSITKWTQACDRRFARLISYIHHTNDFWQYCFVGNTAQHCRLGLFQDSDFAGDLEDAKSTSGGVLCILGNRTFVPVS